MRARVAAATTAPLAPEVASPGPGPAQEAAAPPETAVAMAAVEPRPAAPEVAPAPVAPTPDADAGPESIYGPRDADLLAPLQNSKVVQARINRGGTSLSLRIDFESGGRAAFKPEQIHLQSEPRKEIAAYRIDRLLGVGRVPPSVAVTLSWEELLAAAAPDQRGEFLRRVKEEAKPRKGKIRGAASWWIPEIKNATFGKKLIDEVDGIVTWKRFLVPGAKRPPEHLERLKQISSMVLFDFVIDNSDRWSGANVRSAMDDSQIYYMDNTLSFSRHGDARDRTNTYLKRSQTFSRSLVAKLRAMTRAHVVAALSQPEDAALAPLLTKIELDAMMARRDYALDYIDKLIAEHGEDEVLGFP